MSVQHSKQYKDVPSWGLADSFWERIKPFIPKPKSRLHGRGKYRKHIGGRPGAEPRQMMAGILYVLRTGCQWNAAPSEYGSGKTLHRYFQRWTRARLFKKLWKSGLEEYDEVKGIEWEWQAADGAITKSPLGGQATGANPTDRGKCGTKRSVLVEAQGVPMALEVGPAQRHDVKLLAATLGGVVVERPGPTEQKQHLCLDKAYAGEPTEQLADEKGYEVHVPDKANAKKKRKRKGGRRKARRWVVEAAHWWLNRFRRLLVRWEKKKANYLSMLYFACAIICWRKCEV
jgi:putative transposase